MLIIFIRSIMETYHVGGNSPIKLKVSTVTEAIVFTYVSLNDPVQPDKFISDISFIVTPNDGWKQINGGNPLNGRTLRIRTILDFQNEFADEITFNLAVEQAKLNYIAELTGGDPEKFRTNFKTYPNYERNSVLFSGTMNLI